MKRNIPASLVHTIIENARAQPPESFQELKDRVDRSPPDHTVAKYSKNAFVWDPKTRRPYAPKPNSQYHFAVNGSPENGFHGLGYVDHNPSTGTGQGYTLHIPSGWRPSEKSIENNGYPEDKDVDRVAKYIKPHVSNTRPLTDSEKGRIAISSLRNILPHYPPTDRYGQHGFWEDDPKFKKAFGSGPKKEVSPLQAISGAGLGSPKEPPVGHTTSWIKDGSDDETYEAKVGSLATPKVKQKIAKFNPDYHNELFKTPNMHVIDGSPEESHVSLFGWAGSTPQTHRVFEVTIPPHPSGNWNEKTLHHFLTNVTPALNHLDNKEEVASHIAKNYKDINPGLQLTPDLLHHLFGNGEESKKKLN